MKKSTAEVIFEQVLEGMRIVPTSTVSERDALKEVDCWLQDFGAYPGLLILGDGNANRKALMRTIYNICCDYPKNPKAFKKFHLRPDLCAPGLRGVASTTIVEAAHNSGRYGLFGPYSEFMKDGPLLINGVGAAYEEPFIFYHGLNPEHTAAITEKIYPVVELVERRLQKGLPTIIASSLSSEGIRAKYGYCGAEFWDILIDFSHPVRFKYGNEHQLYYE